MKRKVVQSAYSKNAAREQYKTRFNVQFELENGDCVRGFTVTSIHKPVRQVRPIAQLLADTSGCTCWFSISDVTGIVFRSSALPRE